MPDYSLCNPSAVFSNRPPGANAADGRPDGFEFSVPGVADALGWPLTLRCLRFLLFEVCLHRAGRALRFRQRD
jgi:hypothetical protein